MKIPENFRVLFCQGGASQQFSAVPLNLIGMDQSRKANFLISGKWSNAAMVEAKKFHDIHIINKNVDSLLEPEKFVFDPKADYFFFCQNESIDGIEFRQERQLQLIEQAKAANPDVIVVSDMSSAIGSVDLESLW
jgi:phosphoserine aminotransferase